MLKGVSTHLMSSTGRIQSTDFTENVMTVQHNGLILFYRRALYRMSLIGISTVTRSANSFDRV